MAQISQVQEIVIGTKITELEAGILSNAVNITHIDSQETVVSIGDRAFYSCTNLSSMSFLECETIGASAFENCTKLERAEFPACQEIGSSAFQYCTSLTTASFLACTSVGNYAFYRCSVLTTASFPACTYIGQHAFYNCSALTTASFPACKTIGYGAFCNCTSLTTASFPACTTVGTEAFANCSALTTASFPTCTTVGTTAFCNCSALTTVNLPVCTYIYKAAFNQCSALESLYLVGLSFCKLGMEALIGTPSTMKIYVPATLASTYKSHSDWIGYSSNFVGITTVTYSNGTNLTTLASTICWREVGKQDWNLDAESPITTVDGGTICIEISDSTFYKCSALTTASFQKCTYIGEGAFSSCKNLTSLYLTGSSVCTLANSDAFEGTPSTMKIYIPNSLISMYQSASNWSYYSSRFVGV